MTQPGDLWTLGDHRILCGDALEETSYATLLKGAVARMVFTDPAQAIYDYRAREPDHTGPVAMDAILTASGFELWIGMQH